MDTGLKRDELECHTAAGLVSPWVQTLRIVGWTALAVIPVLRVVDGPAVSVDQMVVQVALSWLALVAIVIARIARR